MENAEYIHEVRVHAVRVLAWGGSRGDGEIATMVGVGVEALRAEFGKDLVQGRSEGSDVPFAFYAAMERGETAACHAFFVIWGILPATLSLDELFEYVRKTKNFEIN